MTPTTSTYLTEAARVADALVYVVGIAGVVAGGMLLRGGSLGFAIVAWVLTFVAGAALRLLALTARGVAELLVRQGRLADELNDLRVEKIAGDRRATDPHWRT